MTLGGKMDLPKTWKFLLDLPNLTWEIHENSHNDRKWLALSFYIGIEMEDALEAGEISWVTNVTADQAETMILAYTRNSQQQEDADPT